MKTILSRKYILCILLLLMFISPVFAAYNNYGIPDSSEFRKTLVEKWFEAPLESVRLNTPEIFSNGAGQKFQVSLEETDTTYNILVAAATTLKMNIITESGTTEKEQEIFLGDIPGSWVLIKDKKTDKPIRIRYYFASDSEVYVQFSPKGRTATADMMIYGHYAAKGISTGVPFNSFYTTSFDDVVKLTERALPWKYVNVKNNSYDFVLQMAGMIQKRLNSIVITDDYMFDETGMVKISDGKPVAVENDGKLYLSSAGFIKWIADGLVEPIAGSKIKRKPLLEETVDFKNIGHQGTISTNKELSLYFSLNWIRNLSAAIISVQTEKNYRYFNSGVDVTVNPFSSSINSKNTVTFIENNGYNPAVLKPLLYVLAATQPGIVYFGAIRETDRTAKPELKVFNECAAFLPYFDTNGKFRCFVFYKGRQIELNDFCLYYKDAFVYLTKVRSDERFFPD